LASPKHDPTSKDFIPVQIITATTTTINMMLEEGSANMKTSTMMQHGDGGGELRALDIG